MVQGWGCLESYLLPWLQMDETECYITYGKCLAIVRTSKSQAPGKALCRSISSPTYTSRHWTSPASFSPPGARNQPCDCRSVSRTCPQPRRTTSSITWGSSFISCTEKMFPVPLHGANQTVGTIKGGRYQTHGHTDTRTHGRD